MSVARSRELIERFLAHRPDRTLQAYRADLDAFAGFLERDPASAVARLLAGSGDDARALVLDYAIELRRSGLSMATVERRLACLRALVRQAHDAGLVDWALAVPNEEQVEAMLELAPAADTDRYLFPRHPGEIDRLDMQHYALRATLKADYLAPVPWPERVLDVGCGSGQWGFELCRRFPNAFVVGVDLVSGKPERPDRYRLVRGNVLQGLPFQSDQFDFVHQRLLVAGVPLAAWPALVADLVRVARPGAWIELVEGRWGFEDMGPASGRLLGMVKELSASLGLDSDGTVFASLDGYLRDAGVEAVERREYYLPIGVWGGAVGSLMATDVRTGFTRLAEVLRGRGMLSEAEARDVIHATQDECERGRMAQPCAVAWGRKPL